MNVREDARRTTARNELTAPLFARFSPRRPVEELQAVLIGGYHGTWVPLPAHSTYRCPAPDRNPTAPDRVRVS